MISTLKIPRVAGTLVLALCGLTFHGTAQASMYSAESVLNVTVTGVAGAFDQMYTRQSAGFNIKTQQGGGSASNTFTPLVLPVQTTLVPNQTVVTNAVSVMGSALAEGDVASSDLMTILRVWLIGTEDEEQTNATVVTLSYDFTGLTNNTKYATATAQFRLLDNSGAVIDQKMFGTGSTSGDGGVYSSSLPVSVPVGGTVVLRFDVRATGTAVPAPAPLALIAGGLLALGASRRRVGATQGL